MGEIHTVAASWLWLTEHMNFGHTVGVDIQDNNTCDISLRSN